MKVLVVILLTVIIILGIHTIWPVNQREVEYKLCNGKGKIMTTCKSRTEPTIYTYLQAVPIMKCGKKKILNVCSFRIISKKKWN